MPNRRGPILAFIISSIGVNAVIMPPPNCGRAGRLVTENSSSTAAAWHTTLSAPVMALLLACAAPRARRIERMGANCQARAEQSVILLT
jgi:hypothetical protein